MRFAALLALTSAIPPPLELQILSPSPDARRVPARPKPRPLATIRDVCVFFSTRSRTRSVSLADVERDGGLSMQVHIIVGGGAALFTKETFGETVELWGRVNGTVAGRVRVFESSLLRVPLSSLGRVWLFAELVRPDVNGAHAVGLAPTLSRSARVRAPRACREHFFRWSWPRARR